jgi:hypothetical protein
VILFNGIRLKLVSLLGLSHYFKGEMDDAEQFLQMAARWSLNPAQNAVALNNLGTLSWTRLGMSLSEREEPSDGISFMRRDSSYFNNKCQSAVRAEGAKGVLLTASELLLLQEALNYWEEAAEECTNEKDDLSNAQQVRQLTIIRDI